METLTWETIEYKIADLRSKGEVITQRDILEKFRTDHPGKEVRAHAGFKFDHQNKAVSIRIGVVKKIESVISTVIDEVSVVDPVSCRPENIPPIAEQQKLLNPGYDELKEKYDALYIVHEELKVELEQTRIALFAEDKEGDKPFNAADSDEAKEVNKPLGLNIEGVYSGAHSGPMTEQELEDETDE